MQTIWDSLSTDSGSNVEVTEKLHGVSPFEFGSESPNKQLRGLTDKFAA